MYSMYITIAYMHIYNILYIYLAQFLVSIMVLRYIQIKNVLLIRHKKYNTIYRPIYSKTEYKYYIKQQAH